MCAHPEKYFNFTEYEEKLRLQAGFAATDIQKQSSSLAMYSCAINPVTLAYLNDMSAVRKSIFHQCHPWKLIFYDHVFSINGILYISSFQTCY